MRKFKYKDDSRNKMSERGELITIGAVLAVGLVLVVGGLGFNKAISENRYIMDVDKGLVYDLTKCSIKNLDKTKLTYIKSLDEAEEKNANYEIVECG